MSSFKRLSARRSGLGQAFTLIELLVVIAIIAILAAILLPVLQKAKQRSWDAGCVNNKHELQMAYIMFSDDNDNKLVGNTVGFDTPVGWVTGYLDWSVIPNSPDTNASYLNAGLLGQYTSQTIGCYACPADIYVAPKQRGMGWTHRIRSVRINGYLNHTPVNPAWTAQSPAYAGFNLLKATDIRSPSSLFVFIDAHPDTGDQGPTPSHPYDGIFSMPPATAEGNGWNDMPASYHDGNACGFSFEDGHAEIHRWIDGSTIIPVTYKGDLNGVSAGVRYNQDIMWTFHHAYNSGIN